ncbi:MAG: NAD(P)H-hydrate epimerase [Planctomycetota bacterium]|nr:NAD(P)H-hydrate epimerase [Planctomycetota bacterium]
MQPDFPSTWPPDYPPHRPLSVTEARQLDSRASTEFGIPGLVLMEHAARGIAAVAALLAPAGASVLILAGPGNNGGDGYGAARFLHGAGRLVRVLRCAPGRPAGGDSGHQLQLLSRSVACADAWADPGLVSAALALRPALVVDALFGVGLARPLEAPYVGWIEALNDAGLPVLAVDVPSGLEADQGVALPVAVRAAVTATMAAPKRGLRLRPDLAGRVVEIDIGLPAELHRAYLESPGPTSVP